MATHHGTDLSVLPSFVAHDAATVDLVTRPIVRLPGGERLDLAVVDGRENLAQALILRLLTPRGSLAALGHGEYGSRLHELLGALKTPAVRGLCRAFVLEALAQEARVAKVMAFAFDVDAETPSSLVFSIAVAPTSGPSPVTLSLEVTL